MTLPDEYRDLLTGFWRADAFFNYLDTKINEKSHQEKKDHISLLVIDIDHFKELNDTYGHLCGDKALKFIALKIRNICEKFFPDNFFPVRYGGDELVVVLDNVEPKKTKAFGMKLMDDIQTSPLKFEDQSIELKVSIGISSFPEDAVEGKHLFQLADRALYISKKLHVDRVVLAKDINTLNLILRYKKYVIYVFAAIIIGILAFTGFVVTKEKTIPVRDIILKSGGSLRGKIIYENKTEIVLRPSLQKGTGKITIPKENILKIKNIESME